MTAMATARGSKHGRSGERRVGKRLLVLATLVAVAFSAIAAVRQPTEVLKERLPIESVRIEGALRHIERPVLIAALADEIDGGFFGVDVARVQRAALDLPWIKEAAVRRSWPNGLQVAVVERHPIARWRTGELLSLIHI